MLDLFRSASDDQLALMGCAAVLFGSGFLMYVSYFVGPIARQDRTRAMELLVRERQKLLERPLPAPREKAA